MIPALQKIVVIVLVLLQFAAPLVHAHTGQEIQSSNLHIPGLESFSLGSNTSEISSTGRSFDHDYAIVGISSAIQQKHQACFDESCTADLEQPDSAFKLLFLKYFINFSPHQVHARLNSQFISQHGTRAPPSL